MKKRRWKSRERKRKGAHGRGKEKVEDNRIVGGWGRFREVKRQQKGTEWGKWRSRRGYRNEKRVLDGLSGKT